MKRRYTMVKKNSKTSDNHLETLERVKEQYQQYVEVSGLYELPKQKEKEVQYQPPSPLHPLTSNITHLK